MAYDYREAMEQDIREAIEENYDLNEWRGNREGLEEKLNDDLWIDDSVTGNASGSYTFNSYKSAEYVKDNMDLCGEMIREFCVEADTVGEKFINEEWEWFDVSIRCYLLAECINTVLDEMELEGAFDEPEEESDTLTA